MGLDELIHEVEERSPSDEPLDQLETAVLRQLELAESADQLLDHFVRAARESGCSWNQIGNVLGVTKQAAQQRHGSERGVMSWLRRHAGQRNLWTKFTERAKTAVVEAQQVARDLGHNYIGTEHVLAGILTDPESLAAKVLAPKGLTRSTVIGEIEERIGRGDEAPSGHIPFTPRAKKVLELTLGQALQLGHNYIGTEHVLLGIIEEGDGVGAQILAAREVTLDDTRAEVVKLLTAYRKPD